MFYAGDVFVVVQFDDGLMAISRDAIPSLDGSMKRYASDCSCGEEHTYELCRGMCNPGLARSELQQDHAQLRRGSNRRDQRPRCRESCEIFDSSVGERISTSRPANIFETVASWVCSAETREESRH
jgi:hypothetical protein